MATLTFTVDSALLAELGEKLVESAHVALVELVKNSYDADATKVMGIAVDSEDLDPKGRDKNPHITVLFGFKNISVEEIEQATKGVGHVRVG